MTNAENNKLIAEFMGYKNLRKAGEHPLYYIPERAYKEPSFDRGDVETVDTFSPYFDDMKFNNSWDWLMSVVHKCLELCNEEILNEWEEGFQDAFMSCNIERLYKECVEFIQWYNKNTFKIKTEL